MTSVLDTVLLPERLINKVKQSFCLQRIYNSVGEKQNKTKPRRLQDSIIAMIGDPIIFKENMRIQQSIFKNILFIFQGWKNFINLTLKV